MGDLTDLDSVILGAIPITDIPDTFNKYPELRGVIFDYLKGNYPYKEWMIKWINDSQEHYDVKRVLDGSSITDEERDYFVNCIVNADDKLYLMNVLNYTRTCLFTDKLCDYIVLNELYTHTAFLKLLPTILKGMDDRNVKLRKMFVLSLLRNNKMIDFIMFDNTYMRKGNDDFNGIPLLTEKYLFDSIPDFPDDYQLGVII